jgi:hypothetical protein
MFMSDLACIVVDVDGPYSGAQGLDYFEASRRRRRRAAVHAPACDPARRRRAAAPAGAPVGLIPAFFRFGTAAEHYLSTTKKIPILGCECGEWGHWPLMARVHADDERVIWTDFEQPHRPRRDYSAFGPLQFRTSGYDEALRELALRWHPSVAR